MKVLNSNAKTFRSFQIKTDIEILQFTTTLMLEIFYTTNISRVALNKLTCENVYSPFKPARSNLYCYYVSDKLLYIAARYLFQ